MKNVIYINCWVRPWLKVAKQLLKENDLNPIWWIGYVEDNSKELILSEFPYTRYMDVFQAWKGQFPKDLEDKASSCNLDVDYLRKHAGHELQAIKMMDRLDPDRNSFNFMERQRHYRNYIKKWMAVVDFFDVEMVISTEIPHRFYDYVLFWLCQERNIPYVLMNHTPFAGRYLLMVNDFYSINNSFIDDWRKYEKQTDIKDKIPSDVSGYFEKVKMTYGEGAPKWMKEKHNVVRFTSFQNRVYSYVKRFFSGRLNVFKMLSNKPIKEVCELTVAKNKSMKYEESYFIPRQRTIHARKKERYLKELLNYYEKHTSTPDYVEPYVCMFLHYQPEATTSPGGDIFVDQRLCVEVLLKNLPPNYKIYVKEHRHQFLTNRPGQTSRMKDFYDDLIKNERVKLISTTINSFDLMQNAKAVATVTGTVGWEAIVREKPVIVFGMTWYENYSKGVLRITDDASGKKIQSFIETYQYDEHSLLAYLAAFGKNTNRACYFREDNKEEIGQTEDESADIIANSIKHLIEVKKII